MIGLYFELIILGIGIVISVMLFFVGAFFTHIILFDSILSALIASLLIHFYLHIHPAICLLIGIVLLALLFWLQNTQYGFWIIGMLFSVGWALVFASISYDVTHGDKIWFFVTLLLALIIMVGLHIKARDSI